MTREYVERKANLLAKDYNAYKKMKYTAAYEDYKTALDNLLRVARKAGINYTYTMDSKGFITID